MPRRSVLVAATAAALAGAATLSVGQHNHQPGSHASPQQADARMFVQLPDQLREHTLANMRDHLLALQQIQAALAERAYDQAARIAETRLGMSSLQTHGAHEVAKYMPQGMQDAGTSMHRSASRFAVSLQEAAISNDLRKPLGELAAVTASCVACHAGYRIIK